MSIENFYNKKCNEKIMKVIVIVFTVMIMFGMTNEVFAESIPDWVKNIFGWYAQDQVSEDELLNAIKYLIKSGILVVDTEMILSSDAFGNNEMIPSEYTCDGDNISPMLRISEVPQGTASLALIMDDPDAPMNTFVHWVAWNIPPSSRIIEQDVSFEHEGVSSFGSTGYGGPCPPSGIHRYFFKLYALDTILTLDENSNKNDLEKAMAGHVIEETKLIGKYSRIN